MKLTSLLLLTGAWANDFKPTETTVSQAQFSICDKDVEAAVRKGGEAERVPAWEACLKYANAAKDEGLIALVTDKIAMVQFEQQHADLMASDPLEYSKVVLATAVQRPDSGISSATIRDHWALLIADSESRLNIPLRQVTVRILTAQGLSDEEKEALDVVLRRYLVDVGFKAPEGFSAEASDSDVFVQLEVVVSAQNIGASSQAVLTEQVFSLKTSSVRYKKLDARGDGWEVTGVADYVDPDEAKERAMYAAGEAFADRVLLSVITQLYGSYPLP